MTSDYIQFPTQPKEANWVPSVKPTSRPQDNKTTRAIGFFRQHPIPDPTSDSFTGIEAQPSNAHTLPEEIRILQNTIMNKLEQLKEKINSLIFEIGEIESDVDCLRRKITELKTTQLTPGIDQPAEHNDIQSTQEKIDKTLEEVDKLCKSMVKSANDAFESDRSIVTPQTKEKLEELSKTLDRIASPSKLSASKEFKKEKLKKIKQNCKNAEKLNRDVAFCFLNPTKKNIEKAKKLQTEQLKIETELKSILDECTQLTDEPYKKKVLALIPDRLKDNIAPEKTKRMMWKQLFKISRHPIFFKWCISNIGFSILELGKGTAKKLSGRVQKNNPSPINKAIATIHTRFSSLGAAHLRMVLGSSLILPSRNILQTQLILGNKDIELGNHVLDKGQFEKTCTQYARDGASFAKATVEHTYSGICEGTCLQLSIDLLQGDNSSYLEIAEKNIEGAPIEAYVNQLCYNSTSRNPTYTVATKIVESRIEHALNANSSNNSLFNANGKNVKDVLNLLIGRPKSENDSKIYHAAKKWQVNTPDKNRVKDIQLFYESLKEELKDDSQALNELEWVVSAMEMINYCTLVEEANSETCRNPLDEYTDAKGNKIAKETLPDQFNLEAFVSNQDTVKTLQALLNLEFDFAQSRPVANFRAVDYERMDNVVGQGYMHKDDAETLEKMSLLPDGVYMLGIQIGTSAHALQYFKEGDEEYLFDPNFGVIDCRGGKLKEEFLKLLQSPFYPPAKNQGPHSSGKSHNIVVHKVKKKEGEEDQLNASLS